ncbi:DUF4229 domain-containing protein [Leekyejoonella antrihumi]|uniref:DUF4229 domain-containing protein n=1 Tax=Leekyejoonella antrihumi TaxID=1660198 RepID=A0A563DYD5_9MICO|nr:DUF4229 domain-containing protein [Leekyejoonella antrihumi]TWP34694.1 DUF4229 domain-containing protein [Leekyejoonella antrihumi]
MIQYSFYRIFIFIIVFLGLWVAGLRSWLLLIAAAAISAVLSLVFLNRPREKFAAQIEHKVEERRLKSGREYRSAEEDEDDEVDGKSA